MLRPDQDAYGHLIHDFFEQGAGYEIAERGDGFVGPSGGAATYFTEYGGWPEHQKKAIKHAEGRVLDIGSGAGRVGLYLQGRGHEVLGIDNSPLALKTCRLRGLKHTRLVPITQVSRKLGIFDTVVMFGNNFGLFGSLKRARWLLKRFRSITHGGSLLIVESTDPYQTDAPHHLAYHRTNRKRGRMSGQLRLRICYHTFKTPWFDYLLVSKKEMEQILDGTGWRVRRYYDSAGPSYAAIIERSA